MKTKYLNEVAEIRAGNSAPQGEKPFNNGRYNFYRTFDVGQVKQGEISVSRDKVNKETYTNLKKFQINTILFPKSGASTFNNNRVIIKEEGAIASHLAGIKANPEILNDYYLYYFLLTIDAKNLVQDSAYPSVNLKQISQIEIPVPSLREQEKIAEKLDKVFENINLKLISDKNKIELYEQLCKSKLNQIFKDELVKSGGAKLKDLVDLKKGKKPEISPNSKGNLPYLTAKFIRGESEPEYGIPNSKGSVLINVKDYVIIMDGSNSGEVFSGLNGILASTMGKLILKQKINLKYLGYFLESNKENFANTKTGSAIPHLSKDVFFNLQIPMPSLNEQEKIVKKLDKFFENITNKLQIIDNEILLIKNFKKSILNKEFSYE